MRIQMAFLVVPSRTVSQICSMFRSYPSYFRGKTVNQFEAPLSLLASFKRLFSFVMNDRNLFIVLLASLAFYFLTRFRFANRWWNALMKHADGDCGCVIAISQRSSSSAAHLQTIWLQYSSLNSAHPITVSKWHFLWLIFGSRNISLIFSSWLNDEP